MCRSKGYTGYTAAHSKECGSDEHWAIAHIEIRFTFASSKQLLNSRAPMEVEKVLVVLSKN